MKDIDMALNAAKYNAYWLPRGRDEYALSVNVALRPGMTPDDVAVAAQRQWAVYHDSTVGALASAGYEVRPTKEPDGHTALMLPTKPSRKDWDALRAIFGPERQNPKRVRPHERTV
ncbi:MAG: hypothetical protein ACYC1P_04230 [Gaiellaceae bacterium]